MHGIVENLWGAQIQDTRRRLRNGEPITSLQHAAYTRYYLIQQSYLAHELGIQDKVKDCSFLLEVAQLLRCNVTHQEVVAGTEQRLDLLEQQKAVEYCGEIVNFTARLLVMMNVGRFMSEAHLRRNVVWESSSLRDCVNEYFAETPKMTCESIKLPKTFNAWSIETVGGIKVRLTDNLADHLLLVEDDTTVLVFHHASFLECQDERQVPVEEKDKLCSAMQGMWSIVADRPPNTAPSYPQVLPKRHSGRSPSYSPRRSFPEHEVLSEPRQRG